MPPLATHQIVLPIAACVLLAVVAGRIPRYRFALLGFVAIVGYAVLQDQVSARLCPEYFTVLHRPIPGVTDPTLLGVCWGFLGGWWGGALLGYAAGLTATIGPRPKLAPWEILKPLALLIGGVAVVTALTGLSVWRHSEMLGVVLDPGMAEAVPPKRHRALFTVACYHFVAYASSAVGSVVLCVWVASERRTRARQEKETGLPDLPDDARRGEE
ncbi:hypothetical protein GobsT_34830 [Gemmata obscuriglobus]|uniref:Uncharacterized protein n=1 Tax=Gemmata obscuriglobus TaxID=114 RepID=A0A2Z3GX88_9BACT|nr:hypothetical protein [Gemmata obscuriglobus]AWM38383.1 hypothetical protein C1280_16225 [Gemmata obscuriglobus]QEG28697.1 hypothetical protein GobsT_34830 [Gemmata obscuriglobus]VTS06957.1 Uncharacterized protein OS=Pedosphaera parvula (strain Ellin514) GN=Cflav_PD1455 PE=4 SV=1 [Gemmata obscuriglobus UQM 2246]